VEAAKRLSAYREAIESVEDEACGDTWEGGYDE
jgi:hypothetical protein